VNRGAFDAEPRRGPLRSLIILAVLVGVVGSAVVGTWRVVDEIRDPRRACVHQLPAFQGLQILSVERSWTPPIVRCDYFAALVDQLGTARRVNAVTTKNLIVVAALDVLAVFAFGFVRGVLRRRRWI
jgi:hypothetical protein